jgi:hypothetical protein
MMRRAMGSPRPVPLSDALVVKKGSKMWALAAGSMPHPVSLAPSMT